MDICCGIVTYNPDIDRLKKNIDAIINQVDKVYIYDNASNNLSDIKKITDGLNVDIKCDSENNGIAVALNAIVNAAVNDGYKWALTLDQDTICPNDIILKLSKHIGPNIGIICPGVIYETGRRQGESNRIIENISACMTSGSLTNIKAVKSVGGYNNDYFIDYVDNEICMKLRINGYSIIRCNECVISHQLGETRNIKLPLIGTMVVNSHNPWRLYYMVRNNYIFIMDYKKNLNTPKEWMKLIYILLNEVCFSTNKRESIKCIRDGLLDAKKGMLGKRNKEV